MDVIRRITKPWPWQQRMRAQFPTRDELAMQVFEAREFESMTLGELDLALTGAVV